MRRLVGLIVLAACGGGGAIGGDDGGAPDAEIGPMAEVHTVGRFDADGRFAWPGSTILTRFDGTDLSITLEESGANHYDVTVDGVTDVLVTSGGMQTYALADGLAPGEHTVIVARRTESFFGTTRFHGLSGDPLVATPAPTRLIEVIGDSITCGYGVLGAGPSCSFDAATEAETHAWGALAARELGVAHTAIAYSGIGVYRNYGGEPGDTMPDLYERTFADDPGSAWDWSYTPDVVVINLGTNDFSTGDPGQAYVDAYADFIAQIRGHHGAGVPIVVASSPMLGDPDHGSQVDHLAELLDEHVTFLDLPTQLPDDGYGCDWHPSEATQQKMADALVAHLRDRLGW